MLSAHLFLISWLSPVLPLLGMRRKAEESVNFSYVPNESLKNSTQLDEAPCSGLMWTLSVESSHSEGWRGSSFLLSTCDGIALLNTSLPGGESLPQRLCLPEEFKVDVHRASELEEAKELQWRLHADKEHTLSGGAPFSHSGCEQQANLAIEDDEKLIVDQPHNFFHIMSASQRNDSAATEAAAAGAAKAAALVQTSAEGVEPALEYDEAWTKQVDPTRCRHWHFRFWPQVSFLTQEVRRRVHALPEEPSPEQQNALREFTKKMSFLGCQNLLDPRQGHELPKYAQHILPLWEELANAPATSLEVPKMDAWFKPRPGMVDTESGCSYWLQNNVCHLGYVSEQLSGNKARNATCWSTLKWPHWHQDHPSGPDTFKLFYLDIDPDPLGYTDCQEKPLDRETVEQVCEVDGNYAPGPAEQQYFNPYPHWTVRAKPPKHYDDVLKCNKKLGVPRQDWPVWAKPAYPSIFDYGMV